MAVNINGLIYYKLDANVHGYQGDVTKNCGLRGEEIDGNFNFLRGNDIQEISFDDSGSLFLKKYNGEIMSAKPTDTPNYDFNYNPENGSLTIVTPDGKEIVLSGFKVTTNVFHNNTLVGNGSQEIPLEVSNITRPGRYRPAIRLIDTTINSENGNINALPTDNIAKNDRYVTREKIHRFGRLYPLSGVEKITERLKNINSEWHVPSKEEWDIMLNEIDCATPTHSNKDSNMELGEFAGSALKATKYWESDNNNIMLSEDKYGFTIYPVGYCGNRGKNYYGSFGRSAAFWTSTVEDNHKDMYIKKFEYDKETVGQQTWGDNFYLSLRLVKKFTGNNFNESEHIDGYTVNCMHMPGTGLIWTSENIGFSEEQYDGFFPEKWTEYENNDSDDNSYVIRYYVNDWNGNGWDKHEIKEGEGIVLYEGDNGRMHEWLLIDGELIDSAVHIKEEFRKELDYVHGRIDEEIANRTNVDNQLWDAIAQESKAREEVDTQQWEAINTEIKARTEVDAQLWTAINNEATTREDVDKQIWSAINQETEARETVEKELWNALLEESSNREKNDSLLWDALNKETEDRNAVDKQTWDALGKEIEDRTNTDNQLWNAINQEAEARSETDTQIWSALNKEIENRETTDKELWTAISEEAASRIQVDDEQWVAINNLGDALAKETEDRLNVDNKIWETLNNEIEERKNADEHLQDNIDTETIERKDADAYLQQQIDENKVVQDDNSVVIVPGNTSGEKTTPTTIKVNIDNTCEHLKLGDNGIYFDGYFGQF